MCKTTFVLNPFIRKIIIFALSSVFLISLLGTAFGQSEGEALRLYKQGMEAYQFKRY